MNIHHLSSNLSPNRKGLGRSSASSIMMPSHRFVLGLALAMALLFSGDSGFAVVKATSPSTRTSNSRRLEDPSLENVAGDGTASQSSTFIDGNGYVYSAGLAIDGNTDEGDGVLATSVAHTNLGANNWWQVDLDGSYDIRNIVIWNRNVNTNAIRLIGSRLEVFDASATIVAQFDITEGLVSANRRIEFNMNVPNGQRVRIFQPNNTYLHVAEVEIYAKREPELPSTLVGSTCETVKCLGCNCCGEGTEFSYVTNQCEVVCGSSASCTDIQYDVCYASPECKEDGCCGTDTVFENESPENPIIGSCVPAPGQCTSGRKLKKMVFPGLRL